MSFLSKKWKELVYTLTSNDRYVGYHTSTSNADGASQSLTLSYDVDNEDISATDKQQAQLVLDAFHAINDCLTENTDLDNFQDYSETLSDPCTILDIKQAQKDLSTKLPHCVITYFLTHDGQELSPSSTRKLGLLFGLQLMSLDETVTMTNYWRRVAKKELEESNNKTNIEKYPVKKHKKTLSKEEKLEIETIDQDPNFKLAKKLEKVSQNDLQNYPDLVRNISKHSKYKYKARLPNQKSIPPKKIKLSYSNENWIPLVTDYSGNHIGIDLDPDVDRKYGQVIIFGREFDTKFVIADNWGEFLQTFVRDLENEQNWTLKYNEEFDDYDMVFIQNDVDVSYFEVLRQRVFSDYKKTQQREQDPKPEQKTEKSAKAVSLIDIDYPKSKNDEEKSL